VIDDAEVYASNGRSPGDFDRNPIPLGDPRAAHGAVVLATGETLLVGGVGADGVHVLDTLEIVDPITRSARTQSLATLTVARKNPIALRLASGEILVAGGFDDQGAPVSRLDWLSGDAKTVVRQRDLVARAHHAFTPLAGGGALAVIAPDAGDTNFQSVWVISRDGAIDPATPLAVSLGDVRLFPGAEGSPRLWTGAQWMKWDPWLGSFSLPSDLLGPSNAAIASPDLGLAMWLDPSTSQLTAYRFDARGAFSSLPPSLLATDTQFTVPDRLVLADATPTTSAIAFSPSTGLSLATGASVFVADTTYADVTIDVDAPSAAPPIVVLRDERGAELEVGGASCLIGSAQSALHVARTGATVTANGTTCTGTLRADARVSIGVRGAANGSLARNLRVVRGTGS
jgi:hypothetical protein